MTYGKFVVEPFERGFGTTVGNSLRRILLSSLEGAAPISVKIAGAEHEFAHIDGVLEDVTDIILNIKGLIISMDSDEPKSLTVTKKGPGVVTAGDLVGDAVVDVQNENLVIANLTGDVTFSMDLDIHKGRGFVTALENTPEEQIIGTIPIDSIYSPVTRVRYKTEDTRVGQKTNYDRLIIEGSGPTARSRRKWRWLRRPRFCASTSTPLCSTLSRASQWMPICVPLRSRPPR